MTYPAYVPTRNVTLGGAATLESGSLLQVKATFTASRALMWAATGYRFESVPVEVTSTAGSELTAALPCTDTAGWRDGRSNGLIDVSAPNSYTHEYTARVWFLDQSGNEVASVPRFTIGPFVLPAGTDAVDLDTLQPADTVAGGQVLLPDEWTAAVAAASAAVAATVPGALDTTVAGFVNNSASATKAALSATYVTKLASSLVSAHIGQDLPIWKAKVAQVLAGTAGAKVLCVGDSTTGGIGTDGQKVGTPTSYPYQLAAALSNLGIPSAVGMGIPPSILSGNTDPRWTPSGSWAVVTVGGFACGADYSNNDASSSLTYAPGVPCDRFDIYYLRNSTLPKFTVTVDGEAPVTVTASGTAGVGVVTVSSATIGVHTVSIARLAGEGGNAHIVGIEPWVSTASHVVRVANAGVGGSLTSHWAQDPTNFGSVPAIKAYAPDLTIISLGINDAGASVATSAYLTNLGVVTAAALLSGDVLLVPPLPSQSGADAPVKTGEAAYESALRGIHLPRLPIYQRWGVPGTDRSWGMADLLHPNAAGYADLATYLAQMLHMASL